MTTVRKASVDDVNGIARVRVDTWRSAYSGIIPSEYLDGLEYEESARQFRSFFESGPGSFLIYVVEDIRNDIVGFICAGPERQENRSSYGEIYAIYIMDQYQGQGLGTQLVSACASDFKSMGKSAVVLWVLADNPYRAFYDSLKGQICGSSLYPVQDHDAPILAYEWRNLDDLIK